MNRRDFVLNGFALVGASALPTHLSGADGHAYRLAPVSMLPKEIRNAPSDIRDSYRFAVVNRNVLQYIPCYCGCINDGHTSNACC